MKWRRGVDGVHFKICAVMEFIFLYGAVMVFDLDQRAGLQSESFSR